MKENNNYMSYVNLRKAGVKLEYTQDQIQEIVKCIKDPIYFIRNYVKIVSVDRGIIPFELWDFQERMINTFHENRFSIAKMPRQVGKTTSVAAYLLWCVLFNDNFKIAILANKHPMAKEIVGRIQMAYENLPFWMQQGVLSWNKTDIALENGSIIMSSSTTGDSIRGQAMNLVYLDEFAFVPNPIQETFFTSVYPTISSGKSTKIMITSTPNGMNRFHKIWKDSVDGKNTYKRTDVHWSDVPGRDEAWREETIRNTSERQFRQEFGCEFLGSDMTLIAGDKLQQLTWDEPIYDKNGFKFYEQADRSHSYVMVVDTARGTGLDYSAFVVFDTSVVPYKVVATFRDNNVHTIVFPKYIMEAATFFNNAHILVETNDLGQQIVDILHHEMEYDNLISTISKIKGHEATGGFGARSSIGVRTSKAVKRLGCATFKSMVESDQLIVRDNDLIEEMSRFALKKGSYEASTGNDDLVMCGVLFAWLSTQPYFKELTGTDVVRSIYNTGTADMDMIVPFGIIDTGHDDPDNYGGDLWHPV
jgi:hypothetical protein